MPPCRLFIMLSVFMRDVAMSERSRYRLSTFSITCAKGQ